MKRNFAFLPSFNQRPIERTKQERFAASADESVFNFAVIVVVIQGVVFY
jgi:hypothetical protein